MSLRNPIPFPGSVRAPLLAAALLSLAGCLQDPDTGETAELPEKGMIFAVTSDYKTGSYAAFGLDSSFTSKDIAPIHSDAGVRYAGGGDIFILNRLGRDNLQVVDRKSLETVMQVSFPALSNPYDVAVKDSLLYVGFFGYPKIGVYRQADGEKADEIDLASHADTSDGLPETTALQFIGGNLYALLANLDSRNKFLPLQARLARIDLEGKSVQALDLPIGNPLGMAYDSAAGRLYIPCRGRFFKPDYDLDLDGGILVVDVAGFSVVDTLAAEESLGGSLNKVLLHDGKLYMDLTTAEGGKNVEKVIAIALPDADVEVVAELEGYSVGGLDVDGKTGTLAVGDRKNGLRLFDLASGQEKAESKIGLGLPISDLVVVR